MLLMKKVLLGLAFLALFSLGGAGTQSTSLIMQGVGFLGLIIGLIVLYSFGRMIWKGMGCLPSFLILSAVVLFMMYSLGFFNNGIGGIGQSIISFLGRERTTVSQYEDMQSDPVSQENNNIYKTQDNSEKFSAEFPSQVETQNENNPVLFERIEKNVEVDENESEKGSGIIQNIFSSMSGKKTSKRQKAFNLNDYQVVYGSVRVVNGDTLIMYNNYFRLFGIDAPESNQMCADKYGSSYNCGREAAKWLKNWIGDAELECRVIRQNTKGDMEGTCSYGPYDIGAALVNAGWAVANTQVTDIYYPYEVQAKDNNRGLWKGQFYMPWDWRKMQKRKVKVKIISNKKKKNMFGI